MLTVEWAAVALPGCLLLVVLALAAALSTHANFRRHPLMLAPDAPETPAEQRHPRYVVRRTPPPAEAPVEPAVEPAVEPSGATPPPAAARRAPR